ncbi:MAG: 23S rRNA (uracil(747)-C(5))-methyltransferase, partial [Arachnia sp.]
MGTPEADQLADKTARAAQALSAHPSLRWLPPITSAPERFRNKAKLVVGGSARNPTLGILDRQGRGVDLRGCGLYEPGLSATFEPLHALLG